MIYLFYYLFSNFLFYYSHFSPNLFSLSNPPNFKTQAIQFNKININNQFLILSSITPLIGFLPKWLTIQFSSENHFIFVNFILIMFTLIALLFYIPICLSSLLMNSSQIKWNSPPPPPSTLSIFLLTLISSLGLLVYSLITFN